LSNFSVTLEQQPLLPYRRLSIDRYHAGEQLRICRDFIEPYEFNNIYINCIANTFFPRIQTRHESVSIFYMALLQHCVTEQLPVTAKGLQFAQLQLETLSLQ